jgi:hypothetical protein
MRFIVALSFAILLRCPAILQAADSASGGAAMQIPKAWLQNTTTVAEAEAANPGITDDRVAKYPEAAKPFGFKHGEWEALKVQMRSGDELWTFASPAESWEHLADRAGIALIRDGNTIAVLLGAMN